MSPRNIKRTGRQPSASREQPEIDPHIEIAMEEAEGVEVFTDPFKAEAARLEREEAEGIEVFEDANSVVPLTALREGSPGHEGLSGDHLDLERSLDQEYPERELDEEWPET